MGNLFRYIFIALILCMLTILAFCHQSQVLLCILTVIVPGFIWNLLGGGCLYKIRTESGRTLKRLYVYYILSFLIIVAEQAFITLLNTNLNRMIPFGKAVYHLSSLLLIAAVVMLLIAICRLYRGYYLSFGMLTLSCGMIGSLFLYLDYLMRFDVAGGSYILGFLPYLVSLAFSVICFLCHKK